MLYLSAPFDQAEINSLVVKHVQNYPIAYNQLDNLRWIGFSKWGQGVVATSHVCSKNRTGEQLLSYYNHLQLAASLCLLFELTAII